MATRDLERQYIEKNDAAYDLGKEYRNPMYATNTTTVHDMCTSAPHFPWPENATYLP